MLGQRGAGRLGGRWRDRTGKWGEKWAGKGAEQGSEIEKQKIGGWLGGKKPEGRHVRSGSRLTRAGLGLGGVGTGSALCTREGGWVWTQKLTEIRLSGKYASTLAPHHPHLGHALAYHLALRANTLHAPSQCTEMSPPPASQVPAIPHTASPGYGEVLTELLPPVSPRPAPLSFLFFFLLPFPFFLPLTFPSPPGMERVIAHPQRRGWGGGDRRQTPLLLFKASGPPPPK